jgi:hypothetical protein
MPCLSCIPALHHHLPAIMRAAHYPWHVLRLNYGMLPTSAGPRPTTDCAPRGLSKDTFLPGILFYSC